MNTTRDTKTWKEIREEIGKLAGAKKNKSQEVCPDCGRCPTCGRKYIYDYYYQEPPRYPWLQPNYWGR